LEEAAAALGMPEKLLRRSAEAKAKALGVSVEQVIADMLGTVPVAAVPVAASVSEAAPAVPVAEAVPVAASVPEAAPAAVPGAGSPAAGIPTDAEAVVPAGEVDAWPALFKIELVTAAVAFVFLVLLALAGPAPLFAPAGATVDPSKAPWYLLWLEQLLAWLPSQVAGFFVPLLLVAGAVAVPFVDPEKRTGSRRLVVMVFGLFVLTLVVLTLIGFASRSSGFGWPWT
jgi:hypothetical protein